jgi:hypothetical protein
VPAPRLYLATFGRLLSLDPETGRQDVLHEGNGKYYGLAPAADEGPAAARIAVVSRPSEKGDDDRTDHLLEIDTTRGAILRSRPLRSLDTHQILRAGDRLFVTDTERGEIHVHEWPSLRPLSPIRGFTHENHVNSLATDGGDLLVLCHNKGPSWFARVSLASGQITARREGCGENAHDLVPLATDYAILDSKGGGLLLVPRDASAGAARTLWSEPGHFTKGLVVEDGIAWFAVSRAAVRAERRHAACDVVGVELTTARTVYRGAVDSRGLVNAVATERSLARQRLSLPAGARA